MKRLIVLATGLLAALAVTVARRRCSGAARRRRLLRLGGRRRSRVRQPRRSDRDGQLGPHGRERAEGAEPVRDLQGTAGQRQGQGAAQVPASVPVWIHVISDGATGNVPQSVIDEQMSVLNLAFAGFYGGAASGFSFTLAGVTRTDNAAWYNARINSNPEREMKKTLHRGGFDTLNVYTNLAGGYLGYAYLPGLPDSHLWQDGIVLNWESMPDASPTFEGRSTSASRSCTRRATGSTSSTRSSAPATPRATSSTTRRRCASRRAAAPRARTPAASRGSTRSTTTWTTRTTPVTTSSRRVRSAGCRTAGSSTGRP